MDPKDTAAVQEAVGNLAPFGRFLESAGYVIKLGEKALMLQGVVAESEAKLKGNAEAIRQSTIDRQAIEHDVVAAQQAEAARHSAAEADHAQRIKAAEIQHNTVMLAIEADQKKWAASKEADMKQHQMELRDLKDEITVTHALHQREVEAHQKFRAEVGLK